MREYSLICDMCGKHEISSKYTPDGWEQIEIKYQSYSSSSKTICQECAAKIGLPIDTKSVTYPERASIEQRMLDIIQEIAYYSQG